MFAPVTAIYAAVFGMIFVALSYRVIRLRWRERVPLGHGTSKPLRRAVRVQGNAAEYLPLVVVLMLVFELNGGARWELHIYGIATVVGRLLHAAWLSRINGHSFGRYWGTLVTFAVIISLALANLRQLVP